MLHAHQVLAFSAAARDSHPLRWLLFPTGISFWDFTSTAGHGGVTIFSYHAHSILRILQSFSSMELRFAMCHITSKWRSSEMDGLITEVSGSFLLCPLRSLIVEHNWLWQLTFKKLRPLKLNQTFFCISWNFLTSLLQRTDQRWDCFDETHWISSRLSSLLRTIYCRTFYRYRYPFVYDLISIKKTYEKAHTNEEALWRMSLCSAFHHRELFEKHCFF